MSFVQLLAIHNQYIVQDAADAKSAVEQLVANVFSYKSTDIVVRVENKQFSVKTVDFYVQPLGQSDYLIYTTSKLNKKS